jgi:hypothetical protein
VEIIAILMKILGSSSIGSAIGWVGGLLNRMVDVQVRKLDLEFEVKKLAHELDMRDKDAAIMQLELAGKEKIAVIQTEGAVQEAAYEALKQSFEHDASIPAGPKMAAFSKFIRPFTSMTFLLVSQTLVAVVLWCAFVHYDVKFEAEFWKDLVIYVVSWEFFQASLCIGWWFANRPSGGAPSLPQRRVGAV